MSPSNEEFSDSDDGFSEDMELLRRACQVTGKSPTSTSAAAVTNGDSGEGDSSEAESDGQVENDLEFVRNLHKRFLGMEDEPLKLKPLCTLPPDCSVSDSDDCLEDYETLRAINRRFAAYKDGICCPLFSVNHGYLFI